MLYFLFLKIYLAILVTFTPVLNVFEILLVVVAELATSFIAFIEVVQKWKMTTFR